MVGKEPTWLPLAYYFWKKPTYESGLICVVQRDLFQPVAFEVYWCCYLHVSFVNDTFPEKASVVKLARLHLCALLTLSLWISDVSNPVSGTQILHLFFRVGSEQCLVWPDILNLMCDYFVSQLDSLSCINVLYARDRMWLPGFYSRGRT